MCRTGQTPTPPSASPAERWRSRIASSPSVLYCSCLLSHEIPWVIEVAPRRCNLHSLSTKFATERQSPDWFEPFLRDRLLKLLSFRTLCTELFTNRSRALPVVDAAQLAVIIRQ